MIISVVVSIASFHALGWTQFTETQSSTAHRATGESRNPLCEGPSGIGDEAFADLLKKRKQLVGLMASLRPERVALCVIPHIYKGNERHQ
jgi:hypothetical protein